MTIHASSVHYPLKLSLQNIQRKSLPSTSNGRLHCQSTRNLRPDLIKAEENIPTLFSSERISKQCIKPSTTLQESGNSMCPKHQQVMGVKKQTWRNKEEK